MNTLNLNKVKASTIIVNSLGTAIQKARMEKEMTTTQLADLIEVNPELINYLESDTKVPAFWNLVKLEKILQVDISKYDNRYRFNTNAATNLKITRKNLKMTRKEFWEYAGCSKSNLDNWEYFRKAISKSHFDNLVEKLGDDLYIE